jgi:hypothetical protein
MSCEPCGHSTAVQTQTDNTRQVPVLDLTGWLDSILDRLGLGRIGSAIFGLVVGLSVFAASKLR